MKIFAIGLLLLLASCREKAPPVPTSQQADRLNEADAMLNDLAQNEEGPEQRPGPSK